MSRELVLRIISAIVLIAIALLATAKGGWVFELLCIIAGFLIYYEWTKITGAFQKEPTANFIGWITLIATFYFLIFGTLISTFLVLFTGAILAGLMALKSKPVRGMWIAIGIIYAGFPVIALTELRGESIYGLFAIAFIFLIVWSTDILAFFCGRALGGRKLMPSVSPGKTWSGAIFGLAAGLGAGVFCALLLREGSGLYVPLIAGLLSALSQIGDLFESWVKRRYGVKDSSNLIPGHGGVMDRLDGLIFASVAAFVIATIEQYIASTDSSPVLAIHLFGL